MKFTTRRECLLGEWKENTGDCGRRFNISGSNSISDYIWSGHFGRTWRTFDKDDCKCMCGIGILGYFLPDCASGFSENTEKDGISCIGCSLFLC